MKKIWQRLRKLVRPAGDETGSANFQEWGKKYSLEALLREAALEYLNIEEAINNGVVERFVDKAVDDLAQLGRLQKDAEE